MLHVDGSPLFKQSMDQNVMLTSREETITQGYQGDELLDSVSVNRGNLRSLNALAPSAASPLLPSSLIARDSRRWFSSMLAPGWANRPFVYAMATCAVFAAKSFAKASAAGNTSSRVGRIW